MAKIEINIADDLPAIRDYISRRVAQQSAVTTPITAIEVGFGLCQAGWLLINFDTRNPHETDGEWTVAKVEDLKLQHWSEAYEGAQDHGAVFILPTGARKELRPREGDDTIAGVFGESLQLIILDSLASGVFTPLPLSNDCELDFEEFDAMWSWKQSLRKVSAARLPR